MKYTRIIEHTIITQGEDVEAPNIDDNQPASLTPYLLLIEKMKIAALKTALKERGMGTRGKKMDLKNRLIHAVNEGTPVLTPVEATKIVESSRKRIKKSNKTQEAVNQMKGTNIDNIMGQECHKKTMEKRTSMASHFNFCLAMRTEKIRNGEMVGTPIESFEDVTWEDLNEGSIVGEWASYLQDVARKNMKINQDFISYSTATGYMSSFKCALIDKFHKKGVPAQFESQIWSQMLAKIRQSKFQYAQKHKKRMFGSKIAASKEDNRGLVALVLWKGSVQNAEFMMLFHSMIHNCGRGSEIAILTWESCKLKLIEEAHGYKYETLSQHVLRVKTEGQFTFSNIMFILSKLFSIYFVFNK